MKRFTLFCSFLFLLSCGSSGTKTKSLTSSPPPSEGFPTTPVIEEIGVDVSAVPKWIGLDQVNRKYRPQDAVPYVETFGISAAKNEFEAFQVVMNGEALGKQIEAVTLSDLSHQNNHVIPKEQFTVYLEELYHVPQASNDEGAAGFWPDPLIPAEDEVFHEKRNIFPLSIAPNETRVLWIEVLVPQDAEAGSYLGTVNLQTSDGDMSVPISLHVYNFALPSTSSLKTAFGIGWDAACGAHHGGYNECGGDAGIEYYNTMYARFALDHRISLDSFVYGWPRQGQSWNHFDELYEPFLKGSNKTRLPFAKLTSMRSELAAGVQNIPQELLFRMQHWQEKAWNGTTLFHYTCDEPPNGCTWQSIQQIAPAVQLSGMQTLVTTGFPQAKANNLTSLIDILVPAINWVGTGLPFGERDDYDDFLSSNPKHELWWYQSCLSHGCGNGCETSVGEGFTGYPSYVIDASALQARAMEWFTFQQDVGGELYFSVAEQLSSSWNEGGLCAFSGSGDGTLLYPGLPSRIGGERGIPLASMRLKLIREGLEDYEYLNMLKSLGEEDLAKAFAQQLFPDVQGVTAVDPNALYEVRNQIARAIEAKL
ncbi:MAG: hypothetical protein COX62_04685 [Deltaproteobacteria bacterium CG_4_10_14_0_2_um_filter_43_8]|nr:MAG: hypothetical protein COV43_03800 [Deltaproteobacteria bacterium CG11_big_fil_rev_8_21_14_0_20_42_23]PJA20486.1 MAG: hypothetical protein COX62_04685 [Deltaproteobacteria bacterium CG_4_10_14_0_2_um_filter_43_8]PJC63360.1 MAG: hypothetical protein CO021_09770 [Deltaproteobacteria bacterium CG_4_9_14_0_2_um_filter_42_21]